MARDLLADLLRHDAKVIAAKLGLVAAQERISDQDAAALLNMAEGLSRRDDLESRQRCLLICGLLWEHRSAHWKALPGYVTVLLSRLGLDPSIGMVNPQDGEGTRSPIGSLLAGLAVSCRAYQHEVEPVSGTVVLSGFQHALWQALKSNQRVGVSAPTSAGKSFVLARHVVDIVCASSAAALYVVPTLSLIHQVTSDIRALLKDAGRADITVLQSYSDDHPSNAVYVLTQERCVGAFENAESLDPAIVVLDEIQNIERVSSDADPQRARALLDVLEELVHRDVPQVVICGPQVANMDELTKRLLGPEAAVISHALPPVVNVTYSFSRSKSDYELRQYAPVAGRSVRVRLDDAFPGASAIMGKQQYGDGAILALDFITQRLVDDGGLLVFAPTSQQAEKIAREIADRREPIAPSGSDVEELATYLRASVHPSYSLAKCIMCGIAFHHGKVPPHVRIVSQLAFAAGLVSTMVCTTTLMQGVNLPAKTILARNPDLFVRAGRGGSRPALTPYEFANLRGRAGRLLKDFVGRVVVLDEAAFNLGAGEFDFPSRRVEAGYSVRFEAKRTEIIEALLSATQGSTEDSARLAGYIRYALIRHGSMAAGRLRRVGIDLTAEELRRASSALASLRIPRDHVVRLPFWDPLVLEALYSAYVAGRVPKLPATPFVPGCTDRVSEAVRAINQFAPSVYAAQFGNENDKSMLGIIISAVDYAREVPLVDIVSRGSGDAIDGADLERRIARVSAGASFALPRLLQPLAVFGGEGGLLSAFEHGTYRRVTRRLVSLGLPRELALAVVHRLPESQRSRFEEASIPMLRRLCDAAAYSKLSLWERRLLDECWPR